MKIAVISPHRDDAAFSLGLSIDRWLAAKAEVHVLNCFSQSAHAPYSDVDSLHANDRVSFVSATRKREDLAWNKLTGGKLHITDLDLLDAPLRLACSVGEVAALEIRPGDRAVARVAGAIAKLARRGFVLALPLAIGGHIDHRVTRQAGLQAFEEAPFPLCFYEDLPYAARPGEAETSEISALSTGLGTAPGFAEGIPGDMAAQVARKRRIVDCYDTQIDSEVAGQIAAFCERYGGRECFWSTDAWRTSAGAGTVFQVGDPPSADLETSA